MPMGAGGAIVIDGLCTRKLGALKPGQATPLTLRCIALEPGMQTVAGMQLVDALTETVHEVGPLADVFVQNDASAQTPAVPHVVL
jgi:hypothetical protein